MSRINEYISETLRKQIAFRANYRCEYCLILDSDTYFGCEVDHIVSIKHGGRSDSQNLAYACMICNRFKGSDLGSLTNEGKLIRFYNPRADVWSHHFEIKDDNIVPLTEIGNVTASIFRFNDIERRIERIELQKIGHYPIQ